MTHTHPQHSDMPATHGMLMVGEKTIYLSHLPMFESSAHRYQVILEAALTGEAQAAYRDARKKTGSKFYTVGPSETFTLPDLVSADPSRPPVRTSFQGDVFVGVFDMDGQPIPTLQGISLTIANVVYFQKLNPQGPPLPELKYLLFGKGGELFMAHLIAREPDFDQVLAVGITGQTFSDAELRRGVPIVFPGRANSADAKLNAGEQIAGETRVAGQNAPRQLTVQANAELYLDTDMVNQ
jgi:hypothetical protein